ncbi:DUF6452 family protein [Aquimarina sediminis]|uniref:DUF6452 family protein n=1 Tax=Aquimarina sediminis TaxID=2070536 RepID=UPI000CA08531|nr:DUF6452 family protein [Aquimarina sediminis]
MRVHKYLLSILTAVFILYLNSACERDDICAEGTPTTPFLVIKFLDFDTGTEIKSPAELEVKAVGIETPFTLGSTQDSILIPLKNDVSITDYEFTINSDTTNNGDTDPLPNKDTVSFQYTTEEEYVSSACGFKINYKGLTVSPPEAGNDGSWIQDITIQRENVTDETAAHIFIFH